MVTFGIRFALCLDCTDSVFFFAGLCVGFVSPETTKKRLFLLHSVTANGSEGDDDDLIT